MQVEYRFVYLIGEEKKHGQWKPIDTRVHAETDFLLAEIEEGIAVPQEGFTVEFRKVSPHAMEQRRAENESKL